MSFILDAIAKSEQERQQQQTPDARSLAFPAAAPARSRRTAPYVIAGLLLTSAILTAVWMQSPGPLVAPVVGPGGSAMPAPSEAAQQPQAPADYRDAPPAESPQPVAATRMIADSSSPPAASSPPAGETVETPAVAAATRTGAMSLSAGNTSGSAELPVNEVGAVDSLQARLETADGASGTSAMAATVETPPVTSEAPRRRVSRLSDLPADVRRVLPSVVFTGHLYSKNPRASYVFIDGGRQVVAGQQITDGLVLDEITPSGVVVEFQGYLIEVGVLQNWSLK